MEHQGEVELTVERHPLLDLGSFTTCFPEALGELPRPAFLDPLLALDAVAPLARTEETRAAVRDLLRHGGYKPTGRGKPASEYLLKAAGERTLGPINVAVDLCNAVSLHSGLPISVVDLDRAVPPFRVAVAPEGSRYVFNPSGQEIDVGGLLCLFDAEGPCGSAVKDAQRTKTHAGTTRTLSLVWGTRAAPGWTERTLAWYRELCARAGAATADAAVR